MKIRNGFVSNSSTSSFLIYGIIGCEKKIQELIGLGEDDSLDKKLNSVGLNSFGGGEVSLAIGLSWDEIKDDQTGKQFKEDIKEKLKKLFGKDMECSTHEESWYNG